MGVQSHIDQLMHYVIIEPASLDGTFVLHCIHAVVALGLCMPIILGLPFLTSNNIVCDYTDYTCTATKSNPPYDLLTKSHKTKEPIIVNMSTPDILAALRECITTLSFEEQLAEHEVKLHHAFHKFSNPLHTLMSCQWTLLPESS